MATPEDKAKIKDAAERKKREVYVPVQPICSSASSITTSIASAAGLRDRLQGQERPAAGTALPPCNVHRGRHIPGRVRL